MPRSTGRARAASSAAPALKQKKHPEGCFSCLAVGQGFEPREPLGSTVFKTAAFDHSASPPKLLEERRSSKDRDYTEIRVRYKTQN